MGGCAPGRTLIVGIGFGRAGFAPPRKSSGSLWWVKIHYVLQGSGDGLCIGAVATRILHIPSPGSLEKGVRLFQGEPRPSPASQGRANYKPTPAAAERVEGLFADDVHAGRRGEFELFGGDAAVALHVAEGEDGLGTAAVYHHRGDGVAVQDDPERVVFFLVGFGF